MDREALALRNRTLAHAFHQPPLRHRLRQMLIQNFARIPIPTSNTTSTNRILLIRPDHLGDVLLTTPAIRALRAVRPYAEIHMLVGPWSAFVFSNYPEVDMVLTLPFPGFSRSPNPSLRFPYQLALSSAQMLRRIGYGSAVVMRPDHWWGGMIAKLAGIPERIGYDLPSVAPFLTDTLPHRHQHVVLQNMRLVERWTGFVPRSDMEFSFAVQMTDTAYVDGYLEEWGIPLDRPIFCIHPGSGTWVKRWREEDWATVADVLSTQLNATVVLTGSDHEMSLVQQIAAYMKEPACIMAGDTRIEQLAALFQRALVVLGPDSGPLHLAVAVNTPTVTLYGPADPVEFGPWGDDETHAVLTTNIACRPCRVLDWGEDAPKNHPCVHDISVPRVLEAARRVIQTSNQG